MSAFVLRAHQYPVSPWKNGLGVTRTVAISPADSTLASFAWRISMADVGERTPFSPLPGVDRWLMPAAGQAIAVAVDGREQVLQIGDVLAFSGDSTTSGGVTGDSATHTTRGSRDLNLMMRRPHHGGGLQSLTLRSPADVAKVLAVPENESVKVVILLDDELDLGVTKLRQFDALLLDTEELGRKIVDTVQSGTNQQAPADDTAPERIELPAEWFAKLPDAVHSTASQTVRVAVATICATPVPNLGVPEET